MQLVSTAIIPVVLILALGAVLKRRYIREPKFWSGLEWIIYRIFTPALFISSISQTDLSVVPLGPLALAVSIPILIVAALVVVAKRLIRANGPQITSLIQGTIRMNTYIGLVFASALHGADGVATFALACAIVVPLVNIISVTALVRFGEQREGAPKQSLLRQIVTNPLILGCVVGLLINVSGIPMPGFFNATLEILADPALATGTLIAGAAISFSFRRRDAFDLTFACVIKLLVLPLSAAFVAAQLGVDGATFTSIVIVTALPAAPSSYILASIMGGDTRLMASISGVQTVASVATLPLVLYLAGLM